MQGNLIAHLHTRTVWVWDKENDQTVTVRLLIGKDKNKTSFAFPMLLKTLKNSYLRYKLSAILLNVPFRRPKM